jgi:hypothetical protein
VSARLGLLLAAAVALACRGGEPRGPCDPSPPPGELGSVCGFANPEDVAWVPAAGLLLVSQMRHADAAAGGSLAALPLGPAGEPIAAPRALWPPPLATAGSDREAPSPLGDPACTRPPEAARFAPHGLAAGAPRPDGEIPVAAVGHGVREAVELFALRGAGEAATLRWNGCVRLPESAVGNDVWLGGDGALWVTNYQPALGGLRGLYHTIAGGLGLPTGEVLRWRAPRWESVPGTRGANPNGLLLLPGGAALAVAFTGAGSLGLRPLAPAGGSPRDIALGGHPDNLTWSSRATLLVPVHTSGLAMLRCRFGALPCRSPWTLMEIDPATGAASRRFSHDGSLVGGVSSVAEAGDRLYFGAVFDDRIGIRSRAP